MQFVVTQKYQTQYGKIEAGVLMPQEQIARKILLLSDEKVMLECHHLAEIYSVETKALKNNLSVEI